MIKLISTDLTLDAAAVEGMPSRTVSGVAVPYGVMAQVSSGEKSFLKLAHYQPMAKPQNCI